MQHFHNASWWRDLKRAAERLEDLERLADLRGRFAGFEIDNKAQTNARGTREFVLPQAYRFAGGADDSADFGWGEGSFDHDIYRTVKYHRLGRYVHINVPIGKMSSSGRCECIKIPDREFFASPSGFHLPWV